MSGDLRRSAARGGAITLITQVFRASILIAGVVVLGRLVAPSDFGLIAMVVAITGVAEIFRDFGLSMSALRSTNLTQPQRSNLFWLNTALGFVLACLVFGLSWPLASFYGEPQLVSIVQWISPVYLINGLAAQFRVSINQAMRFTALAVIDIASPLVAFVMALVLALLGHGIVALVALQTVAPVVALILAVSLSRWYPGLPSRAADMRELLTFGLSFSATQVLSYFTRNVDSIAIGRVWGSASLGYYDRATQLSASPLNQINAPLSRVAVPALSRVVNDRARYFKVLREAQLLAAYVTSTALFLAAGLGAPLISVLLGPEWAPAAPIFSILAIGCVFRAVQQIAYWMFMTQGLAGSQLRLYLIGQPIIIVCVLGGLAWGPIGVATGSAIGWGIFWIMSLWWVSRVSKTSVKQLIATPIRVMLSIGAPVWLISFFCANFIPGGDFAQIAAGLGGAIIWVGLVSLISRRVRAEVRLLFKFALMSIGR